VTIQDGPSRLALLGLQARRQKHGASWDVKPVGLHKLDLHKRTIFVGLRWDGVG